MSRARNLERIITGVARQAVEDAGANGIALLDDGSPEAKLLGDWFDRAFGSSLHRVTGTGDGPQAQAAAARARVHQLSIEMDLLTAAPVNKTALLLSTMPLPETLLPLGDVYASEVRDLAGGWRGDPIVHNLEALCGGIDGLDAALRARFDQRTPLADVMAQLPATARAPFAEALERARFSRCCVGIVPKVSARTAGIDLFS